MLEENMRSEQEPTVQIGGYKPSLHVDVNIDASVEDNHSTSVTPKTAMTPHVPTNIFVAGLPSSWDDESLRDHYRTFGEIVSTKVVPNRHFGFVMFRKAEAAHAAINATHLTRPLPDCPTLLHVSIAMHDEGVDDLPNERIFVRGLPQWATKEHLIQSFSRFGKIMECAVLMNSLGQCKGSGFVHFENETQAAAVIENRNSVQIDGWNQPLEIKYSESAEVRQQRQERNRNRQRNWVWSPKMRNGLPIPLAPSIASLTAPPGTLTTSISSTSSSSAVTAAAAAAAAAAATAAATNSMPSALQFYPQPQLIMSSPVNLPVMNTVSVPILCSPQTSMSTMNSCALQPMLNSCNPYTLNSNATFGNTAFISNPISTNMTMSTPLANATTSVTPTLATQPAALLSPSFIQTTLPSPHPTQIIYPPAPVLSAMTSSMPTPSSSSSVASTSMLMIRPETVLPQKGDLHFFSGSLSEELLHILIEPYGKIEAMKNLGVNSGIVVRMTDVTKHNYISQLLNGTVFSNGQILAVGLYAEGRLNK